MPDNMQDMFKPENMSEKDAAVEKSVPERREKAAGHAPPGGAESGRRKPLPRGEPFQPKNSLVNWSPR